MKKLTRQQKRVLMLTGSLGKAMSMRPKMTRKGMGSVARPTRSMLKRASKLRK